MSDLKKQDSALVYMLITVVLISVTVSALVARFIASPTQQTCYVFDLKKAVRICKNAPDFGSKVKLMEQVLNYYEEPVFLKGVIVNHVCVDITDEVLAEVQRANRPAEKHR